MPTTSPDRSTFVPAVPHDWSDSRAVSVAASENYASPGWQSHRAPRLFRLCRRYYLDSHKPARSGVRNPAGGYRRPRRRQRSTGWVRASRGVDSYLWYSVRPTAIRSCARFTLGRRAKTYSQNGKPHPRNSSPVPPTCVPRKGGPGGGLGSRRRNAAAHPGPQQVPGAARSGRYRHARIRTPSVP
jgi:hypothetical protein